MFKRTMLVIFDAVIGVAVAAVLLAMLVPLLIRYDVIALGDLTGSVVIGAVLVLSVGGLVLRPGSALRGAKD